MLTSTRRRVVGALALPLLTALSYAQADAAASKPPDLRSELATLKERVEKSGKSLPAAAKEMRPEFEAFAKRHAGSEEALTAKLWLLQQCWWLRTNGSSAAMEEAAVPLVDEILAEYPDSKQLDKIAEYHYVLAASQKAPLFEKLLAASPHDEVKAAMLLGLGKLEAKSKDETVRARAKERFTTLLERYKDVQKQHTTYGAVADAHLNPIPAADLAVGKPAPEILGSDHEGRPMKLSDYRGKAILLDFWGFW